MIATRRAFIRIGGGFLAGLACGRPAWAQGKPVEIAMRGNADGSKVWFAPVGLLLRPGQRVRWVNRDPGNAHTSTAYHPANDGHPLRIPPGAEPWNSDYLLPEEFFEAIFTIEGVYDYFCVPHEHAGMAGRIVVAAEGATPDLDPAASALPDIVERTLPPVEDILRRRRVFAGGTRGE